MPNAQLAVNYLLYLLLPLWLLAGFADWICHRRTHISRNAGTKESLLHLLMLLEVSLPLLLALFLEVNALVLSIMLLAFFIHQATAFWDVSYAVSQRKVSPIEQHIHSYLEMIPFMAVSVVSLLHWDQFLALFGLSDQPARFTLEPKQFPIPWSYVAAILVASGLLAWLPYLEELWRTRRDRLQRRALQKHAARAESNSLAQSRQAAHNRRRVG